MIRLFSLLSGLVWLVGIVPQVHAAEAPPFPCRNNEPPPARLEILSLRHGTLKFPSAQDSRVYAWACVVAPKGMYATAKEFSWNLAVFYDDLHVAREEGGVLHPQDAPSSSISLATQKWDYATDHNPLSRRVMLAIASAPCGTLPDCNGSSRSVTAVLNPIIQGSAKAQVTTARNREAPDNPRCLDSVRPKHDVELHDFTVATIGNDYRVYTCLVSSRYAAFKGSYFNVRLWGADGTMAAVQDGNPRSFVDPLIGRTRQMPRVVSLLAYDRPALATMPAHIVSADVNFGGIGCTDATYTVCTSFAFHEDHRSIRIIEFAPGN